MRAAMVGGAGYMAGKSVARGSQRESDQEARLEDLESQQQYAAPAAPMAAPAPPPPPAPVAAPAAAGGDLVSKIQELKTLLDEGVLTPEEFAAAKAQLLAG